MRFVYVMTQPPYRSSAAREALDMALACAAFDQEVSLLFCGEGLYQLLSDQQTLEQQPPSHLGVINVLPLYDVSEVVYLDSDLERLGLQPIQLVAHARGVNSEQWRTLMASADILQSF